MNFQKYRTDGIDELSLALQELRLLNPLATGVYGRCVGDCTSKMSKGNSTDRSGHVAVCLSTCQQAAVAGSNGLCSVTDGYILTLILFRCFL